MKNLYFEKLTETLKTINPLWHSIMESIFTRLIQETERDIFHCGLHQFVLKEEESEKIKEVESKLEFKRLESWFLDIFCPTLESLKGNDVHISGMSRDTSTKISWYVE